MPTKAGTRVSGKLTTGAAMEHANLQQTRIEQKYRGLLECAPDATVIADKQGTIVLVNTEAERLFGYSRDELLGENVEILVPEGLRDRRWEKTPSRCIRSANATHGHGRRALREAQG